MCEYGKNISHPEYFASLRRLVSRVTSKDSLKDSIRTHSFAYQIPATLPVNLGVPCATFPCYLHMFHICVPSPSTIFHNVSSASLVPEGCSLVHLSLPPAFEVSLLSSYGCHCMNSVVVVVVVVIVDVVVVVVVVVDFRNRLRLHFEYDRSCKDDVLLAIASA